MKGKILGIVWGYLYSGREQQAWDTLEELWPAGDIGRIRAAITSTRTRGISAQTAGLSRGDSGRRKKRAAIFDAISRSDNSQPESTSPIPILITRPPQTGALASSLSEPDAVLNLLIDSAGKVRFPEPVGKATADPDLIQSTAGWKFIPAFKNDRAVACRMRLAVSLKR